jgi:hypothetical protein
MCDLASEVGKLGYWVEDMIALVAEVDGQAPPPAVMAEFRQATGRAPAPPALEGYGYVLPEDYLRGGQQ